MCTLNVNLESIIIPKYFKLITCVRGRKLRYISKSFRSLRFLLDSNIIFNSCSLKQILLAVAHAEIFVSSELEMFSASITDLPRVARIKSSANAMDLVGRVKLRFKREL